MKKFLILIITCFVSSQGLIFSQQKVWSLEECIIYAIENNIQIKQQVVQTEVQQNSLDLAKLKLLPTLNAQMSHDYSFGRALDFTTYEYVDNNALNEYFSAGGGMTLFNGLVNYNTIQKSKAELLAGREDLQNIKDNISLNIALAYLQILLNKELVSATNNQLQITLQQIEKTRRLVEAGSTARGTLLQIEAQAAQEELQLINMQNQLDISFLNITQLLELKTPEGFEIITPEIKIDTNSVIEGRIEEIYLLAVKNRPEIRSAELKLSATEFDLKIAKGNRIPKISMNHSISTRYSEIFNRPNIDPFSTQIKNFKTIGLGFSLNVPILNGWQVNKSIDNSKLNIESTQYALEGAKKTLYKNIQQAYADAVAALKKFNSSIKAVTSTEESLRYTEQKFNVGMVTPVDYNAAKTQLLNAQSDMSQAKYEFIFKTKVLDFYKGLPLKLNQ